MPGIAPTLFRFAVGLIVLAAGARVAAAEWTPVSETSTVRMFATKQGVPFSGVFRQFTAAIDFDAAHPETGRIVGVVETRSIETEDQQNDTYIKGYLEVDAFPEARFESTSIETTPDGYRASGELTLKNVTRPATLDFTFVTSDGSSSSPTRAKLTGSMTVNRFDYDIAPDVDTSFAGRDVSVLVEVELSR